jgi:putative ABC transport system permease protein
MLVQFFTITLRRMRKELLYTVIKVAGLAIALTCVFLLFLYISDELKYDRYLTSPEQVFRIVAHPSSGSDADPTATTPFPLRDRILNDMDHLVSDAVRIYNHRAPKISLNYVDGNRQFNETRFFFADSTLFRIFNVRFVQGDASGALSTPDALVMTRPAAERYFGDENPIGKVIRFEGRFNLVVTAIIEPLPDASHVQFDMIAAMPSLRNLFQGGIPDFWDWTVLWTYIRTHEGIDAARLKTPLDQIAKESAEQRGGSPLTYTAQPVTDIRLKSRLTAEIGEVNDIRYLYILGYIGLFILTIAAINFINLSLAGSAARTREVGMRKVLGADRSQIFWQYMGESLLTGFLALALSVVLILIVIPWFAEISGKSSDITLLFSPTFIVFAAGCTILVAALAGLYPAMILSSWSPLKLFRPPSGDTGKNPALSRALIIVQFGVAAFLISGTWIVYNQFQYMKNQRLGFDQSHTIMMPTALTRMIFYYDSYRDVALQHASVLQVSGISEVIGTEHQTYSYQVEGYQQQEASTFPFYYVMDHFQDLLALELAAGRFFSTDFGSDAQTAILVNESFVRRVGWGSAEDALGKTIRRHRFTFQVVGVVKDFNFDSLHREVEPLLLELPKVVPTQISYLMVKLAPGNPSAALSWLEEKWKEVDPTRPFEFFFLDERIQRQYAREQQLARVTGFFSIITILISCFGLFGLASYTTERRAKSIGIRKVLGASVSSLILLISREFLLLVLAANVLAIPLVWILMGRWLEDFAFRIHIEPTILISSLFVTLLIAFLSIATQTIRAATRNPVDSLRYE